MGKFKIDLLPGASATDQRCAEHLCEVLERQLEETTRRMQRQLAKLLESDRRQLLQQVKSIGEEEVAHRLLAAVSANAGERLGPPRARLNYTLNREDSSTESRNCKANIDRLRKMLAETVVDPG